jgi:hypothetical protein
MVLGVAVLAAAGAANACCGSRRQTARRASPGAPAGVLPNRSDAHRVLPCIAQKAQQALLQADLKLLLADPGAVLPAEIRLAEIRSGAAAASTALCERLLAAAAPCHGRVTPPVEVVSLVDGLDEAERHRGWDALLRRHLRCARPCSPSSKLKAGRGRER